MSKVYVKNCVKYGGKYHHAGARLDVEKEVAESLLDSGAVSSSPINGISKESAPSPPKEDEFVNPFTEIEIEDKHAKLLIAAGFTNMEELGEASEEALSGIQGISKKLAKEIIECFSEE
ncbi:MAG: helix-hairpin-helix domain-containing protein [Salinimicrobium sediminis]|nr:helix-hairpin-helix domain-containing protein [Salinimicrobium sediminis]